MNSLGSPLEDKFLASSTEPTAYFSISCTLSFPIQMLADLHFALTESFGCKGPKDLRSSGPGFWRGMASRLEVAGPIAGRCEGAAGGPNSRETNGRLAANKDVDGKSMPFQF